jgi:hypothetical protein
MNLQVFAGTRVERASFIALLAFLFLCLLGGGGSRADIWSLLYVRPAAIVTIAFLIAIGAAGGALRYRTLTFLLVALAGTIAIQLIPMPGSWALALPGRETYRAFADAAGLTGGWRPISLTPDLTWNSLLSLLPAAAALIGLAAVRPDQRQFLLYLLVGAICLSAALGLLQLASRAGGRAYLYAVTSYGFPTGFFANRNHHALFLAAALPMLRAWTLLPAASREQLRARQWIASAVGLFLVGMILVTGSRAGVFLGLLGVLSALSLDLGRTRRHEGKRARYLRYGLWAAPFVLVGMFVALGRGVAIDRFASMAEHGGELRLENLPIVWQMTRDFFPVGSGFGSFDPVFRGYETDAALGPFYFNHAHNDVLELVLTGGLPAALVALAFVAWFAVALVRIYRPSTRVTGTVVFGRVGAAMIAMLLAHSLVDYPLRIPILTCLMVVACIWMADAARDRETQVRAGSPEAGR